MGSGVTLRLTSPLSLPPRPGNRDRARGGTSHGVRGYLAFDLTPFPPAPVQGIETGQGGEGTSHGVRGYLAFDLAPFPPAPVQGIETGCGGGVHHMGSGVTLRLTSPLSLPPPSRESRQGAGGGTSHGVRGYLAFDLAPFPPAPVQGIETGRGGGYITWGQGLPCV